MLLVLLVCLYALRAHLYMTRAECVTVQNVIPPSQRILVISIYNIISLIVTAVLLVVSNVVSWRSNYFACIIAWYSIPLWLYY